MTYGYVYAMVCYTTGKKYIGQTVSRDYKFRISKQFSAAESGRKNCPKLYNAIRKHGRSRFYHGLICEATSKEELNRLEAEYIALYNTIKGGYNCMDGGRSAKHSTEHTDKIRKALTGRKLSEEHKRKLSESHKNSEVALASSRRNAALLNASERTRSPESRKKAAMTLRGRKRPREHWNVQYVYWLKTPNGLIVEARDGLPEFCRKYDLHYDTLRRVVSGERKHHCGFTLVNRERVKQ